MVLDSAFADLTMLAEEMVRLSLFDQRNMRGKKRIGVTWERYEEEGVREKRGEQFGGRLRGREKKNEKK